MKNLFTLLFISLFTLGGNAQELAKEYSSLLLDLEKSITSKEFLKAWKKQKGDWESTCKKAITAKPISKLMVEFVSKVYEVKMLKAMVITSENLYDQSIGLSNIYNILKENDLEKWSDSKHGNWTKKLEDVTAKAKSQEETKAVIRRKIVLKDVMVDFETVFKEIFEDSKKGSFANIIEGDKTDGAYAVKVKFKEGMNNKVNVDGDNIYEFQVEFDSKNDVLLAAQLQEAMLKVVTTNVPEGFAKSPLYDKIYLKNQGYRFEFKAEKFVFTAKQPSVLIGASKDGSKVILNITEPVFKR